MVLIKNIVCVDMKIDTISIEDGFQIIMLFLQKFWLDILQEKMHPESSAFIEDNEFFFLIVCIGSSSDDYFETVVERRLNIPPLKQHGGLTLKEELLFQLAIDFCSYFNERFQENGKDSLRIAINYLQNMQKHPQNYKTEWAIWDKVVVDVTEHGAKSLGSFYKIDTRACHQLKQVGEGFFNEKSSRRPIQATLYGLSKQGNDEIFHRKTEDNAV